MNKIVIINHYGNTPDEPGPTRDYELSNYISRNTNNKVEFWVCGYNHYSGVMNNSLKGLKLISTEHKKEVKISRIRSLRYRNNNILRQLNITLFDILTSFKILFSKNIDLIILNVPPVSIFNVMAIKIRRIKLIVDVQDLWPLFLKDMGLNNKLAIKYMDLASKFSYNSATGISTVSRRMLNYIKGQIKDKQKPVWLSPLGINGELYFNAQENKSLIKNKVWKNDFLIMYIGAHNPANDLFSVLDTIKRFNTKYNKQKGKKVSFVFFGDGGELENLRIYRDQLKLNNVFFEGTLPANMVHEYLMFADVCLTNLQKIDSFKMVRPNKIFQYMALSKPIICGIWGETKDIIENVKSGIYIDFNDYETASHKINEFIEDKENLIQAGKNGKQYIIKNGIRENIYKDFLNRSTML